MNDLASLSFSKLKRTYSESYKITEKIFKLTEKQEDFIFGLEDKVLIGFFEEVLRATQSIIILLNADNPSSVTTIVRKVFENRLYIQYLVEKDRETNLRARSYILNYYKNQLNLANVTIRKDRVGTEIRREFGFNIDELNVTEKTIEKEIMKLENNYSDVLVYRKMKDIWYNLDGKTDSLEKLALKLKMRPHYELFYRLYSQDIHSSNSLKVVQATEEVDELNRNLVYVSKHKEGIEDIYLSLFATRNYLLEITEIILKHYKMEKELKAYRRKTNLNI